MGFKRMKMKICVLIAVGWILGVVLPSWAGISPDSIKEMADAQVSIEHLRKQKNVDWETIKARYEILAPLVRETDARHKLTYDADIRAAMDRCAAGEKPKVNMQVLAKGLQHVVVLNIRDEMDRLGESPEAGQKIAALFEGIRPTFTRRDKDFYKARPTLEKAADQALKQISGNSNTLPLTARRELTDIIDRTYGLCVLYEIMKVEKLRDTDLAACEVKVKEAEIFYRIIGQRIAGHDNRADKEVRAMLNTVYAQMDAGVLEKSLNRGLSGVTLR